MSDRSIDRSIISLINGAVFSIVGYDGKFIALHRHSPGDAK